MIFQVLDGKKSKVLLDGMVKINKKLNNNLMKAKLNLTKADSIEQINMKRINRFLRNLNMDTECKDNQTKLE